MSFVNEIRTKLLLDDKDWKKALESVSNAEKSYIKETKTNNDKLADSKKELIALEQTRATDIISLNKTIKKSQDDLVQARLGKDKEQIASAREVLKANRELLAQVKETSKITIAAKRLEIKEINSAMVTQDKYLALLKKTKQYVNDEANELKVAAEARKAYVDGINNTLAAKLKLDGRDEESLAKLRKESILYTSTEKTINSYTAKVNSLGEALRMRVISNEEYAKSLKLVNAELAKTTGVSSFGSKTGVLSSTDISSGIDYSKKIAEEKAYEQAKYKTTTSLLEQKRAEEALTLAQKQSELDAKILKEKAYEQAKYDTKTALLAQKRAEEANIEALKESYQRTYINTNAENKYADAVRNLNAMKNAGAINQSQYNVALEKEKIALNSTAKVIDKKTVATTNLANATIRYLRWAGTIAGVVYAGKRAWDATLGTGIQVAKMVEDNTAGIAALLAANTKNTLSNGEAVNSYQKFAKGLGFAKETMEDLRKASVDTYATFPQLTEIFQQAIGQTLSMGDAFGVTVDDITKNTIQLSQRMSNIAGAIGQPMDRVKEEIRSLLSGNASTDSLVATMLFGSPGEANEAIRNAKDRGVNGLKDLLDSYLGTFDVLGEIDTYTRATLRFQDAWDNAMRDIVEKSGAFDDIKNMYNQAAKDINENSDEIVKKFDAVYDAAKTMAKGIGFVIKELYDIGYAAGQALGPIVWQIRAMTPGWKELNEPLAKNKIIEILPAVKEYNELLAKRANLERAILIYKTQGKDTERLSKELENLNINLEAKKVEADRQKDIGKRLDLVKVEGELLKKNNVDTKYLEEANKRVNKGKEDYIKLQEQIKKNDEVIAQLGKSYVDAQTDKEKLSIQEKINILVKDTSLAQKEYDEKTSKSNTLEINKTESLIRKAIEKNKLDAEQAEVAFRIKSLMDGTYETETYRLENAKREVEVAIVKYNILNEGFEKQKALEEILLAQREYEKEITLEKEKQAKEDAKAFSFKKVNKSIITKDLDQEGLTQLSEGLRITYADDQESLKLLEAQIEKWQSQLDDKFLTLDIKFEGFDDISNSIATVGNSFQSMQKAAKEYDAQSKSLVNNPVKLKQAQLDYADATLSTYSDMTGAVASFYDEDDARREKQLELQKIVSAAKMAMQVTEMAQSTAFTSLFVAQKAVEATAAGTVAVATAAASSPWTGFATAIAMAAMLASFGIMLGGDTKVSTTSDAFSSMEANTGTGTVLGDTDAQSESIVKALETLEDFSQPQYQTLQSMNSYLKSIASNIGGVTSLLIQSGGFAFGEGYEGYDTGYSNNISLGNASTTGALSTLGGSAAYGALAWGGLPAMSMGSAALGATGIGLAALAVDQLLLDGMLTNLIGDAVGSVLGGLFGKTKVSQSLTDSGIYFADTLLTTATESILGEAYQTISTTTTKKSWFSKSSKTSVNTYFDELDAETNRQFSLVLDGLYQTTVLAGDALDSSADATAKSLENFVVSIGKISLKDKTGDEIQESLTAIFGAIGDDIASSAFPLLTAFQGVGEGMFETLTRVATGMEEAEYYINRLGVAFDDLSYTDILNKQGDVGFEALLQSIIKTDEATNGLNNNLIQIIASLDSTAEELYSAYTTLDTLRDTLKFLRLETEAISFASITGAGSLDALSSGISAYIENFLTDEEQLSYNTALLEKEFSKLNIAMPVSKDAFTTLIKSLDLSSESGQELYGRLIILSEGFAEVADEVEDTIATLTESLATLSEDGFATFSDSLSDLFDLAVSLAASTRSTIQSLKYSETEDNTNQLIRFNQLLKDFEASKLTTDTEATSAIYSEILSLSSTIGSDSDYSQDIISKLNTQLDGFEADKDIIRVSIVDGLGELLGLSGEQISQLKLSVADGKLTTAELNSINSYSAAQWKELLSINGNGIAVTDAQLESIEGLTSSQLAQLKTANADGVITNAELAAIGTYTAEQWKEIASINSTGISVTDSQIAGLTSVNAEQKAELIKANADGTIANAELSAISGYTLDQWKELDSINSDGIAVTDSQIANLATLSSAQKALLTTANADSKITNSELNNIEGLTSSNYKELYDINANGLSVTDSQISGLTTLSTAQKSELIALNAKTSSSNTIMNSLSNYSLSQWKELSSINSAGIKVTDSQINALTTLSTAQKAELIKANSNGTISNTSLNAIAGLTASNYKELYSINSNGIDVTDAQIQGLTTLSTAQKTALLEANTKTISTNSILSAISSYSLSQIKELSSINSAGIKVTDSQISGLTSLSTEQKALLIKANTDSTLTNSELSVISAYSLSQWKEISSINSAGIKVTDSQISGLTSLSVEQKALLTKANLDNLITNTELASISNLTSSNYKELYDINANGLSVTDSQIQGLTTLSAAQKAELVAANSRALVSYNLLGAIGALTRSQLAELSSINSEGITVTDTQIANLTTLSTAQKALLTTANADGKVTNAELNSLGDLSADSYKELFSISSSGIKVTDSQIQGLTTLSTAQKAELTALNTRTSISNSTLSNISGLSATSYKELYSINSKGIKTTDAQISNLTTLSAAQKELLTTANARDLSRNMILSETGNISNVQLTKISGLSSNTYKELYDINANGLSVTDSQIAGLTTLSSAQKSLLTTANADGKITNSELNNIEGLTSQQYAQLAEMNTNGISVTDSQIAVLTTLTNEQKALLTKANADSVITNSELQSITGLTETQKAGILEVAENSNYFSTEATLSNLEEYSRLQLDAYRLAIAEENVGVSSKTFEFGDYTGTQEKIDIAGLTGLTGDSLTGFVNQLQSLDTLSGTDMHSAMNSMLSYNGLSYDKNQAADIKAIQPYLRSDISSYFDAIQANTITNNAAKAIADAAAAQAAAKADWQARYNAAWVTVNKESSESSTLLAALKKEPYHLSASQDPLYKEENVADGIPYTRNQWVSGGSNVQARVNAAFNTYRTEFAQTASAYDLVQALEQEKALKGYATGGYTGDGMKYDVAGLVHKGEYVINQENLQSLGGENSVRNIVGGGLQKSLDYLSAVNTKTLEKLDIISQNFGKLLEIANKQALIAESSYSVMKDIRGNTAP